jgi:hypothetical protein
MRLSGSISACVVTVPFHPRLTMTASILERMEVCDAGICEYADLNLDGEVPWRGRWGTCRFRSDREVTGFAKFALSVQKVRAAIHSRRKAGAKDQRGSSLRNERRTFLGHMEKKQVLKGPILPS